MATISDTKSIITAIVGTTISILSDIIIATDTSDHTIISAHVIMDIATSVPGIMRQNIITSAITKNTMVITRDIATADLLPAARLL